MRQRLLIALVIVVAIGIVIAVLPVILHSGGSTGPAPVGTH